MLEHPADSVFIDEERRQRAVEMRVERELAFAGPECFGAFERFENEVRERSRPELRHGLPGVDAIHFREIVDELRKTSRFVIDHPQ